MRDGARLQVRNADPDHQKLSHRTNGKVQTTQRYGIRERCGADVHIRRSPQVAALVAFCVAPEATGIPRQRQARQAARLGQVRDALGERELAQRTYRAILALKYAPQVARDVAEAGLKAPFQLDLGQPE